MEQGATQDFAYEGTWEGTGVVINAEGEGKFSNIMKFREAKIQGKA